MNSAELCQKVKAMAVSLGFDGCAVASVDREADDGFDAWLAAGYEAGMTWLRRTREVRQAVEQYLPGARSVVVLARNYYAERPEAPPASGKVSRYAWGRDYHRVLRKPAQRLAAFLTEKAPGTAYRISIDSGPVRERAWAARAGLGWIGKNSLLLRRDGGSWFFLAVIVTTAELAADSPVADRCGHCQACMEACPTGAIVAPRVVDSGRCLAYHTIENREEIPERVARSMNEWIFGCDICQEVCPWNRFGKVTDEQDFHPRPGNAWLPLAPLLAGDGDWFEVHSLGSPLRRAGLEGLQRNARVLAANGERGALSEPT